MKSLLIFLLLTTAVQVHGQRFPSNFIGKWEGTLQWYKTGNSRPQTTRMRLNVQPTDSVNRYRWQIIYGAQNEDNRPYLLLPVDTAKGHWVIDEQNGIRLDCYWLAGRLTGAFTVSGNSIVDSYRIEGGKMIVEFTSFSAKPLATMRPDSTIVVDSYPVRSFQRAVLRKVR